MSKCIMQRQLQNFNLADERKNTVKVIVHNGNNASQDFVTVSFYDSKPVYFLSSVIPEVKWPTVNKKVYSKALNKKRLKTTRT